jgi:hypothetical protein
MRRGFRHLTETRTAAWGAAIGCSDHAPDRRCFRRRLAEVDRVIAWDSHGVVVAECVDDVDDAERRQSFDSVGHHAVACSDRTEDIVGDRNLGRGHAAILIALSRLGMAIGPCGRR